MYTPIIIMTEPVICHAVSVSFNISEPNMTDTTASTPINDDVLFTPIFDMAVFAMKNAAIEQHMP